MIHLADVLSREGIANIHVQKFLHAPGSSPVEVRHEDMGYGEGLGLTLISEDGVFRSPGVPFATYVRADMPEDLVKATTAACIASVPELKARPVAGR